MWAKTVVRYWWWPVLWSSFGSLRGGLVGCWYLGKVGKGSRKFFVLFCDCFYKSQTISKGKIKHLSKLKGEGGAWEVAQQWSTCQEHFWGKEKASGPRLRVSDSVWVSRICISFYLLICLFIYFVWCWRSNPQPHTSILPQSCTTALRILISHGFSGDADTTTDPFGVTSSCHTLKTKGTCFTHSCVHLLISPLGSSPFQAPD